MSRLTVAIDARLAGGSETGDTAYWSGLLHGLCQTDADARFLLFLNHEPEPKVPLDSRFEVVRVPARSGRIWSLVHFPLKARAMGAQVIHTQYNLSPLVGNRGITTIHDVSFYVGPEWFKPRDLFLLQKFIPQAVRRAKKILVVSHNTEKELGEYIPESKGKCVVTYNALPVFFEPQTREQALPIIQRLGVEPPYVLTVGTRWPRKNMILATDAMSLIGDAVPHKLVITGKPGWGDEMDDPRFQRVGYVTDEEIQALYACADLYLAPSKNEGFGIPLLEAWASDCPVLCSGAPAFVEVAGKGCHVEPSWRPQHWADTIVSLLRDPSKLDLLRKRGRERLAHFSWKETGERTLNAYREVAGV